MNVKHDESFIIEGGHRLAGEITPQGAKNEALQVISATLLTDRPVRISNIPEILDVENLIGILTQMGVKVTRHQKGDYTFLADKIDTNYLRSREYVERCAKLRGSILVVGPLLARLGWAYIAQPGGDKIGRRKIDTHIQGLTKLGARLTFDDIMGCYQLSAPHGLKGTYMLLEEASVTGTANIIMAASSADGPTTIYNAACEPYIQQLCRMLEQMGCRIEGIGSNLITVHPAKQLSEANHHILPDMIEVGSFIGMAAMTRSELTVKNVSVKNLGLIPGSFRKLGIDLQINGDDIYIPAQEHYTIAQGLDGSILNIDDAPWPGLTPDLLSVILVVATQCRGSVLIHQKMFESRLFFVDQLIDMGAQIMLCDPHRAVVIGLDNTVPLRAKKMLSPDIRAGVAMLIAALSARGTSVISNITQINRGYEDIERRLRAIGAHITRS